MVIDRVPILRRCRSLGLDPICLGIDKESSRESKGTGKRLSKYGMQLREKRRTRFVYGVLEKSLRNYYTKASKMDGMVGINLMTLLECGLGNVLFCMRLDRTHKEARQTVGRKHIPASGKSVNIPSCHVKAGDVIEVKEKYKSAQRYKDILEVTGGRMTPAQLDVGQKNLRGTVKEMPTGDKIDVPVNEMLIVELYSKQSYN